MARTWYSVKALSADRAEMTIYDTIGDYGVSGKDFAEEFSAITAANVDLYINSLGGSVFDALLMFNAIQLSGKNVTVKVMGVAASAASYVAMAGTKVTMPENTFMMVHNPLNIVYGNAAEMRDMADVLDKIGMSLLATYVTRSGKPEAEVKALLDAESYLTAAECLALGFCDEVTPAITASAKFDTDRKDVPARVQAIFTKAKPQAAGLPLIDQITAMVRGAGLSEFLAVFTLDPAIASHEAAATAVAQARDVKAHCESARLPEMAAAFIKARTPLADVRASLITALASADEAAHVDTSQRSDTTTLKQVSTGGPVAYWSAKKTA